MSIHGALMRLAGRLCIAILLVFPPAQADVLGHISDDTEAAAPSQAVETRQDRRIIYRVICSPDGEQLPDCEQAVSDVEYVEGDKPAEDGTPSFPPDPEDQAPKERDVRPSALAPQPKPVARKAAKSQKSVSGKSEKNSGKPAAKTKAESGKAKGSKVADKSTKAGKADKNGKPVKKTKK